MINQEHLSMPDNPKPRLQHIEPGQFFTTRYPRETRKLLRKDGKYGHVENAKFALSTELDPLTMAFGDGKGWRKAL